MKFKQFYRKRKSLILIASGMIIMLLLVYPYNQAVRYTSTDEYCFSCHVHDHAEASWRLSAHVNNVSGTITNCVDCHLPPRGHGYIKSKVKHGAIDIYGYLFKDHDKINWESKRTIDKANKYTYESSCLDCHANLYPAALSEEGVNSHLYYEQNQDELTCLNCHMYTGHYKEGYEHAQNLAFAQGEMQADTLYLSPAKVDSFANFTEYIPGSAVSFNMAAIPGGEFRMGSPKDEPMRAGNEGPQARVKVDSFFIGVTEVSWNEFLAWFNATASEGRLENEKDAEVDAFSGATPPWGAPDQGWGKGQRPAITMTHYAATEYCRWLSHVTGKKYRLPTEAEWEYAARGETTSPYFFEGSPRDYTSSTIWNRLFGPDTTIISSYVIYKENSNMRTQPPEAVAANPYGLKNMLGNVAEFCMDWYSPTIFEQYQDGVSNPTGPATGNEHVIRGGAFLSDARDVRSASRTHTQTTEWLKTDPQIPKSIWWYSDAVHVGFRVVCEVE